ncbi:hypothetical protein L3Q67_01480 [Saccharothrix sp. AJ9571]|nr:hypothetical protein L3Q67_01480 [Saccharothrix sp. AJ9571]
MAYDTAAVLELGQPDAARIHSQLKRYPDGKTFAFALDRDWVNEQQDWYPDLREVVQRSVAFDISVVGASCDAGFLQFLLPVGSRLALTQRTDDGAFEEQVARTADLAAAYREIGAPTWSRTRSEFLESARVVPGPVSTWCGVAYHPDDTRAFPAFSGGTA